MTTEEVKHWGMDAWGYHGYPDDFESGKVDLRFKKKYNVWIVRDDEKITALSTVCTHLGCSPLYKPNAKSAELGLDWKGGFFCPCHGSKFDLSGRVHKAMPAPYNLEVPPYYFASSSRIIVGEDGKDV